MNLNVMKKEVRTLGGEGCLIFYLELTGGAALISKEANY